ncbi:hypothetical protein SAMN06297468_2507 [Altererythrobacter xiamenensis]|uniref:Uncharacterized protein n=1 Tax=Altererythrobacter xiamenensis TaxID=1316679 RepID=A0A1Y6FHE3_9SPHN|nr:hypothetical protein [Altererythrobacter xiamenensis]SMQ74275.1 hypothetical protein SAMN06297468_2507 [Altererythrobacter xiamenensis]
MAEQSVSEKYVALANECEKRAKAAEKLSMNCDLRESERRDKAEEAKALWQLRGDYIETGMRLDAARGKKVAAAQKEAAALTNAKHGSMRERRFARIGQLLPKMSLQSAAAQCEREQLGSAEAIVRQWNRHKQKRSDT